MGISTIDIISKIEKIYLTDYIKEVIREVVLNGLCHLWRMRAAERDFLNALGKLFQVRRENRFLFP